MSFLLLRWSCIMRHGGSSLYNRGERASACDGWRWMTSASPRKRCNGHYMNQLSLKFICSLFIVLHSISLWNQCCWMILSLGISKPILQLPRHRVNIVLKPSDHQNQSWRVESVIFLRRKPEIAVRLFDTLVMSCRLAQVSR